MKISWWTYRFAPCPLVSFIILCQRSLKVTGVSSSHHGSYTPEESKANRMSSGTTLVSALGDQRNKISRCFPLLLELSRCGDAAGGSSEALWITALGLALFFIAQGNFELFFSLNHPLLFFSLGLRAEVEVLLALPVLVPLNPRSEQRVLIWLKQTQQVVPDCILLLT